MVLVLRVCSFQTITGPSLCLPLVLYFESNSRSAIRTRASNLPHPELDSLAQVFDVVNPPVCVRIATGEIKFDFVWPKRRVGRH